MYEIKYCCNCTACYNILGTYNKPMHRARLLETVAREIITKTIILYTMFEAAVQVHYIGLSIYYLKTFHGFFPLCAPTRRTVQIFVCCSRCRYRYYNIVYIPKDVGIYTHRRTPNTTSGDPSPHCGPITKLHVPRRAVTVL